MPAKGSDWNQITICSGVTKMFTQDSGAAQTSEGELETRFLKLVIWSVDPQVILFHFLRGSFNCRKSWRHFWLPSSQKRQPLISWSDRASTVANPIYLYARVDVVFFCMKIDAVFVCGNQNDAESKRLMLFVDKIDLHYTKLRRSTLLQQARAFILSGGNDSKEVACSARQLHTVYKCRRGSVFFFICTVDMSVCVNEMPSKISTHR